LNIFRPPFRLSYPLRLGRRNFGGRSSQKEAEEVSCSKKDRATQRGVNANKKQKGGAMTVLFELKCEPDGRVLSQVALLRTLWLSQRNTLPATLTTPRAHSRLSKLKYRSIAMAFKNI
jgi:hypothetical protein